MHNEVKAQIFLAEARGHTETDWFRSYNSFPFGAYRDEAKPPFGPLFLLNDDTLAGGHSLRLQVEEEADVLVLPVVGAVGLSCGSDAVVNAGELHCVSVQPGDELELFNPYGHELINFLQLWIRRESRAGRPFRTSFDLDGHRNEWVSLGGGGDAYRLFIAKVEGREELQFRPSVVGRRLYVFVIEGAFEVQNRLLETRDGLALEGVELLEAEALSNDAILLLLEL